MLGPLEALIRLHELKTAGKTRISSSRAQTEVDRCKAELPPEMVDRHDYLVGRYGASAVVPVKSGCCSGCHVQIPSARQNRLEEGVYVCEQCGRLLYDETKVYDLVGA